jgi:hypothetical protein
VTSNTDNCAASMLILMLLALLGRPFRHLDGFSFLVLARVTCLSENVLVVPWISIWVAVMEEDPSGVANAVGCDEAFVDGREDSWTGANPADSEKDFERCPPLLVGLLCLHSQNQIQNLLLFRSFFFFLPSISESLKCTLPLKDNL